MFLVHGVRLSSYSLHLRIWEQGKDFHTDLKIDPFCQQIFLPSNRMTNGFGSDLVLLAGQPTKIISGRKILLGTIKQLHFEVKMHFEKNAHIKETVVAFGTKDYSRKNMAP